MPLTDHVALVSLTRDIPTRVLLQAAAAIQKQITRDFTPYWGLRARSTRSRTSSRCRATTTRSSSSAPRTSSSAGSSSRRGGARGGARRRLRARAAVRAAHELVHPPAVRAGRGERHLERDAQPRGAGDDRRPVRQPPDRRRAPARPEAAGAVPARGLRPLPGRSGTRSTACRSPTSTARGTSIRCCRDRDRYSFTGAIERPLQILEGGYLSWIDPATRGCITSGRGTRPRPSWRISTI